MPLASPACLTGVIAVTLPQSGQEFLDELPPDDERSEDSGRATGGGGGGWLTVSVAVFAALPPAPVHISVYAFAPGLEVLTAWAPLGCWLPFQLPLAVQVVALVADQVRFAVS